AAMSPPASERAEQTICFLRVRPCLAPLNAARTAQRAVPTTAANTYLHARVTPERHRQSPDIKALTVAQTVTDRTGASPRAARCSPSPRPHGPRGCAGTRSLRDAACKDRRGPRARSEERRVGKGCRSVGGA